MTTHTHHQFGEDIPCDLPDTPEAHYPWIKTLDDEQVAEILMSCKVCTLGPSDHGPLESVKDHEWSDPFGR